MTSAETVRLDSPLTLACGVTLKNRFAKSAMSEQLADRANAPTEAHLRLYGRWASGGTGLVITGNIMVDPTALGEPRNVVVEDERDLEMLTRWAAAGTANGTQLWGQINHPGRQSPRLLSPKPVAPSAVPLHLGGAFAAPRALTSAEIRELIARFARTTAILKKAGFSGVQIHGAHGYLVSQFLSPLTNIRDDEWGGTAEKRRRFVLEVYRAMRAAVGPNFPLGIKLNSADFQRGGFTEEESMAVVTALSNEGIDLIEISGGTYERPAMVMGSNVKESTQRREAYFLEYAQKVRGLTAVPIMLTGGFRSKAAMEEALAGGGTDIIGLARPLAIEPGLPAALLAGTSSGSRATERRTGIGALDGMVEISWATMQLHRMGAGKNPLPGAGPWRGLAFGLVLQGWGAFRRKRGL